MTSLIRTIWLEGDRAYGWRRILRQLRLDMSLRSYQSCAMATIKAEIFVLGLRNGTVHLAAVDGAVTNYVETAGSEPMSRVSSWVENRVGTVHVVHGTSWRWTPEALILSFPAITSPEAITALPCTEITPDVELAHGGPTTPPAAISTFQVLQHGLRHYAWLSLADTPFTQGLPEQWIVALKAWKPDQATMFRLAEMRRSA